MSAPKSQAHGCATRPHSVLAPNGTRLRKGSLGFLCPAATRQPSAALSTCWRPCLARLHERRELCERDGHGEAARLRAVKPAEHLLRDVAEPGAHPALCRVRGDAVLAEPVVVAPLGEPAPRRPPDVPSGAAWARPATMHGQTRQPRAGGQPLLDMLARSSPQAEGCPSSRYSRTLAHARKPAVQSQPEGIQHASTICGANRARAVAWSSTWTSA